MTATFTVLIGSIGRPLLKNALDSVERQQRVLGDQVIVAIDSYEQGERQDVQDLVHSYGDGFIACAYSSGYHWLGVEQINYAMRTIPITGSHIFTIGDDDVFVDGAYQTLRPFCEAEPLRPILYRFLAPNRWLLWDRPRMKSCLISGCCIAAPWAYVEPMHTRIETTHDFDWMEAIIKKSGVEPLWLDYVGVIARPDQRNGDVTHQGIWQCWHCQHWRYREDIKLTHTRCASCGVLIDLVRPVQKVQQVAEDMGCLYV